eukprot:scaffold190423_cov46-Prasinocladus_malaysianus.AAC.1
MASDSNGNCVGVGLDQGWECIIRFAAPVLYKRRQRRNQAAIAGQAVQDGGVPPRNPEPPAAPAGPNEPAAGAQGGVEDVNR